MTTFFLLMESLSFFLLSSTASDSQLKFSLHPRGDSEGFKQVRRCPQEKSSSQFLIVFVKNSFASAIVPSSSSFFHVIFSFFQIIVVSSSCCTDMLLFSVLVLFFSSLCVVQWLLAYQAITAHPLGLPSQWRERVSYLISFVVRLSEREVFTFSCFVACDCFLWTAHRCSQLPGEASVVI